MPAAGPDKRRQRERIDFAVEQVFDGYDPLCDESPMYDAEFHGFAYPLDGEDTGNADCSCTVDPSEPATAILCDSCIYRLTAEAA